MRAWFRRLFGPTRPGADDPACQTKGKEDQTRSAPDAQRPQGALETQTALAPENSLQRRPLLHREGRLVDQLTDDAAKYEAGSVADIDHVFAERVEEASGCGVRAVGGA